jgi:4-hydroxy-tetrahydrodipicolinate reductase
MGLSFYLETNATMKIALIGYGKMGKEVEKAALTEGHIISGIVDPIAFPQFTIPDIRDAEVAIEFSTPAAAAENIISCFKAGIPVVTGTTGWHHQLEEVTTACSLWNGTLFYASNFSPGIHLFLDLNQRLAAMMNEFPEFRVSVKEVHHIHKKDKPSGTAIKISEGIIAASERLSSWKLADDQPGPDCLPIESVREGEVTGYHSVRYKSASEIIEISHTAINRSGFTRGALLAAQFISGKKGVFSMDDLLLLK